MEEILRQIRDKAQMYAEDHRGYENEAFFELAEMAREGLGEPKDRKLILSNGVQIVGEKEEGGEDE